MRGRRVRFFLLSFFLHKGCHLTSNYFLNRASDYETAPYHLRTLLHAAPASADHRARNAAPFVGPICGRIS